ncbi:T9SS type A sorting domain-containing protein, partial [bacterium]|nr:T9SS type A sorting domain-containing protein [bacterium]
LRFVRGDGYRISEVGTLAPGEKGFARGGAILPFAAARGHLDQMLRKEAETAGLTANETESFFTTYQWAMRLLSESCDAAAEIVLYRIESGDYDALFPLTTDPQPAEIRRVLWVYSVLPDAVTETYPVHPPVAALSAEPASRITGVFHEYGFFRETYGGDALDEMDAWGWHFYDEHLEDPTDQGNDWGQYYFDTWGQSPLVTRLSLGVTRMFGQFTGGITPLAGPVEVVLSGDDDTHSNSIFPPGSYPPVVVARQEASGGRVVGYGDLAFLADSSDNVQFSENVFEWLCEGATGGGPDIDIAVAVIEMSLDRGQAITSNLNVWNIGDAPLLLTTTPPFTAWFGVLGPTEATINPGDSIAYELTWTTAGIEAGYHTLYWTFSSNDPNESELVWPVRLRVIGSSAVDPQDHTATVRGFRLVSAAPNPFNARTTVTFELPTAGEVLFDLYNLVGQRVERIAARPYAAGTHEISLDFSDKPAGLYFLRATMGADVRMQKLMLLK